MDSAAAPSVGRVKAELLNRSYHAREGIPTSIGDHGHQGLTTAEVEKLYNEVGYNELKHIEIPAWKMFVRQLVGLMPYALEVCCVVALVVGAFVECAIIFGILVCNACLGYSEEVKSMRCLSELTRKMEQYVVVLRDNKAEHILARLLVPGDVILLTGGDIVPADVDWLEGDVLAIDSAALTGESIPRNYPSDRCGRRILSGVTVVSGEAYAIVRRTGPYTEIGKTQEAVIRDKSLRRIPRFEVNILKVVKVVMICSLLNVMAIILLRGFQRGGFTAEGIEPLLLVALSIVVASIPVALPLVLQVTMAMGAGVMATKHDAVVTSLPALQDISAMTTLCSDKTGTLTTARLSVLRDSVYVVPPFSLDELLLYTRLATNIDKQEDPVDRACLLFFEICASPMLRRLLSEYTLERHVGFTPTYKRTTWVYRHSRLGMVTISKGSPSKIANTSDGGQDNAPDQWAVAHADTVLPLIHSVVAHFSSRGYKSLGVCVQIGDEACQYVGVLPLLDPPRHDTAITIQRLKRAGVEVKMVTGDQMSIAQEACRLVGLATEPFYCGADLREISTNQRDAMIAGASGFAEVLPSDKRQIVTSLKTTLHQVVGMTGDGVNDVSALSAAQCGIAVDGATDAAKNAASIILTAPGLSAVFSALVESRIIFRKLRAYVVYRLAATVHIVMSLTLSIFIAECTVSPLAVVLLALVNDLTMLPIAYDRQQAGAQPDQTSVTKIFALSSALGVTQSLFTMFFAFYIHETSLLEDHQGDMFSCSLQAQGLLWLQLVISTELLIFSTRAPNLLWTASVPSMKLIGAVLMGCALLSLVAGLVPAFGSLHIIDIVVVWIYSIAVLVLVDGVKMACQLTLGEMFEPLEDEGEESTTEEDKIGGAEGVAEEESGLQGRDHTRAAFVENMEDQLSSYIRLSSRLRSFNRWLDVERTQDNTREFANHPQRRAASDASDAIGIRSEEKDGSGKSVAIQRAESTSSSIGRRLSFSHHCRLVIGSSPLDTITMPQHHDITDWLGLRRSMSSISLRPHTPAQLASQLTERQRTEFFLNH